MLDHNICSECWGIAAGMPKLAGWECRVQSYVFRVDPPPAKCRYFFEQCVSAGIPKESKEENNAGH